MNNPLVTIITPTYNRALFLDETIQSVLDQDYKNIEYLVIDDGSKDNTAEAIKKHIGKIKYIRHNNIGETMTVNKGFSLAKGEFVCVVNSDDPLLPGAVSAGVKALISNPEALVAYPDWVEIDEFSNHINENRLMAYDIYNMLIRFSFGLGPGTFIRKEAIEKFGPRDVSYRYAGDAEFWLRMALNGKLVHIPQILATHRTHDDSASVSAKGPLLASEVVRMTRKTLDSPLLPYRLKRMRPQIMSFTYECAIYYFGSWHVKTWVYRLFAILLNPYKIWLIIKEYLPKKNIGAIRKNISGLIKRRIFSYSIRIGGFLFPLLRIYTYVASALKSPTKGGDKRFAVVSGYLPPKWSGGAVVLGRILEGIDPKDYVLISREDGFDLDKEENFIRRLPATYHIIPGPIRMPLSLARFEIMKLLIIALARGVKMSIVLKKERCNAVVATTDLMETVSACIASKLAGLPFFLYIFDDFTHQWWASQSAFVLAEKLEPMLLANTQGVIAPNEFMAAEMFRRYRVYSHIVRNPCQHGSTDANNLPFPADGEEIKIVFTGAVYPLNFSAFRAIIAAMDMLNQINIRLHLYTAQSKDILEMNGLIGPNVEYHFHVPPKEAALAQRGADIQLLPFTFEPKAAPLIRTSGTAKLADYLASGRPIMSMTPSDSYLAWYLENYVCGINVDNEEPEKIAEVLELIINDSSLRTEMSKNALRRAVIDFKPEDSQLNFLNALEVGNCR